MRSKEKIKSPLLSVKRAARPVQSSRTYNLKTSKGMFCRMKKNHYAVLRSVSCFVLTFGRGWEPKPPTRIDGQKNYTLTSCRQQHTNGTRSMKRT